MKKYIEKEIIKNEEILDKHSSEHISYICKLSQESFPQSPWLVVTS